MPLGTSCMVDVVVVVVHTKVADLERYVNGRSSNNNRRLLLITSFAIVEDIKQKKVFKLIANVNDINLVYDAHNAGN